MGPDVKTCACRMVTTLAPPLVLGMLLCAAIVLAQPVSPGPPSEPRPGDKPAVVTIDPGRCCPLLNGGPFFAIGACGIELEQMDEAARAGLNLTVSWGGPGWYTRALEDSEAQGQEQATRLTHTHLNASRKAGLWIVEWPLLFGPIGTYVPHPSFPGQLVAFCHDPLPRLTGAMRDHPALFGYYGPDEPSDLLRQVCGDYARSIRALDPSHPIYFNYCVRSPEWPEVYDILGLDWYAVPGETSLYNLLPVIRANVARAQRLGKPYWHMALLEAATPASRGSRGS